MSSLHVDSITKSYNNKVILSDIFISCSKGEIKGLIGRSSICSEIYSSQNYFRTEKPDSNLLELKKIKS